MIAPEFIINENDFLSFSIKIHNSLGTPTLVPLLVDAREALEPPTSTSIKSKTIKQGLLVSTCKEMRSCEKNLSIG